jgi:hypothetical protein
MARLFVCQLPAVVYRASQSDERVYISRAITNDQSKSEEKETKKKKLLGVVSSSSSFFCAFCCAGTGDEMMGALPSIKKGKKKKKRKVVGLCLCCICVMRGRNERDEQEEDGWMDGPMLLAPRIDTGKRYREFFFFFSFQLVVEMKGTKKK